MMVSIGLGWSVLPLTMIDSTTQVLTIHGLAMQRSLGFIYHGNRSLSNAADAFVEALRADTQET
jgi:DNA-binding transcriptional LysR family regulator